MYYMSARKKPHRAHSSGLLAWIDDLHTCKLAHSRMKKLYVISVCAGTRPALIPGASGGATPTARRTGAARLTAAFCCDQGELPLYFVTAANRTRDLIGSAHAANKLLEISAALGTSIFINWHGEVTSRIRVVCNSSRYNIRNSYLCFADRTRSRSQLYQASKPSLVRHEIGKKATSGLRASTPRWNMSTSKASIAR